MTDDADDGAAAGSGGRGDETVLITGCSSGIGRATAEAFLDEGWTVYASSRDPEDVSDLADAGCRTPALDVTDDEQVAAVVERVVDETGRIDCLVNNAGIGLVGASEDLPADRVHDQFDVNVYGPHRLSRAALPHMREQEEGTIVNVSSVAGRLAYPGGGAYCGSKAALESMSDVLRAEVDDLGVDVVLVQPGPVDTGFEDGAEERLDGLDRTDAYESLYSVLDDTAAIGSGTPVESSPDDVAAVVLEAASTTNPAPRYPVGPAADLLLKARFLPDRVRDRAFDAILRFVG